MAAILTATLAVGLFVHAPAAWGCSCVQQTVEQRYDAAAFVFHGRVQRALSKAGELTVRMTLDEIFKGRLPATLLVHTADSSAACGFTFVRGSRYTVFAMQRGEQLITSACSGTTDDPSVRAAARAAATATQAAPSIHPSQPLAAGEGEADQGSRTGPIAAAALLVGAVTVLFTWIRLTRWRHAG